LKRSFKEVTFSSNIIKTLKSSRDGAKEREIEREREGEKERLQESLQIKGKLTF
jgi:hypothetical protein